MEEQVIKSLMELYAEQGLDLTSVISNPIFTGLPLSSKIKLIKDYASEMQSGTNPNVSKKNILEPLGNALFSGMTSGGAAATAAALASHYYSNPVNMYKNIGKVALVGAGLGAAASVVNSVQDHINKINLLKKLDVVSKNPTDNNALKFLAYSNLQTPVHRDTILGKVQGMLSGKYHAYESKIPHKLTYDTILENARSGNPINSAFTSKDVDSAFVNAKNKL